MECAYLFRSKRAHYTMTHAAIVEDNQIVLCPLMGIYKLMKIVRKWL